MQSTTGKKKVRLLFQITKLLINQLGRCSTRSENVYFVNNEQVLIVVFTAVFCFRHTEHNSIRLKLYNNCDKGKLLTVFKETRQIWSPLKISQSVNAE